MHRCHQISCLRLRTLLSGLCRESVVQRNSPCACAAGRPSRWITALTERTTPANRVRPCASSLHFSRFRRCPFIPHPVPVLTCYSLSSQVRASNRWRSGTARSRSPRQRVSQKLLSTQQAEDCLISMVARRAHTLSHGCYSWPPHHGLPGGKPASLAGVSALSSNSRFLRRIPPCAGVLCSRWE
ncbi:hypothetical protein BKA93DRAFT_110697 [Sparassis latifolia]